LNYAIGIVMKT